MMHKGIVLIWTGILAIILLFVPIEKVIEFKQTRPESCKQYYIPLNEHREFSLTFTHSIHLSDVKEIYRVTQTNEIEPYQMIYEDLAIGMPGAAEKTQTFEKIDGKWVLTTFGQTMESFTLYNSSIHKKLEVVYDNRIFDLKNELPTGGSYLIQIKEYSWISRMKGEQLNGRK
ncbi:DUF1850 domain-containing protein [Chryseomicrobium palamuruense]|uniref:DUF1850 domain-containing protein n=1 Tax=Chryseomicrobium palamuruense TaxID=682973 RepID=A0ABV8UVB0_9BACL